MKQDWVFQVLRALIYGSTVASVLIVGIYSRAAWHRSTLGRSYMNMKVSLMLTLLVTSATYTLGPNYPGRRGVLLFLFGYLTCALWFQVTVQWRARLGHLPEQRRLHQLDADLTTMRGLVVNQINVEADRGDR